MNVFVPQGERSVSPTQRGGESGESLCGDDNAEDEGLQKLDPVGNNLAAALKEQNAALEKGWQGLSAIYQFQR